MNLNQSGWSPDLVDLYDLISNLIVLDPLKRFSAAEALNHTFMQNSLHKDTAQLKAKVMQKS